MGGMGKMLCTDIINQIGFVWENPVVVRPYPHDLTGLSWHHAGESARDMARNNTLLGPEPRSAWRNAPMGSIAQFSMYFAA